MIVIKTRMVKIPKVCTGCPYYTGKTGMCTARPVFQSTKGLVVSKERLKTCPLMEAEEPADLKDRLRILVTENAEMGRQIQIEILKRVDVEKENARLKAKLQSVRILGAKEMTTKEKREYVEGILEEPHSLDPRTVEVLEDYVSLLSDTTAVEVVRCQDCRHYRYYGRTSLLVDGKNERAGWCQRRTRYDEDIRMLPSDFCSYGKRKCEDG